MTNDLRDAVATTRSPRTTSPPGESATTRRTSPARPQFDRVMSSIPKERLTRLAVTAARTNPGLTECTPLSLAGALLTTATLGLEPNTPLMESFLVPYKNHGIKEAQLIIGYQGLFVSSSSIPSRQHLGEGGLPRRRLRLRLRDVAVHRPPSPPAAEGVDRGEPISFYAVALLTSGRYSSKSSPPPRSGTPERKDRAER